MLPAAEVQKSLIGAWRMMLGKADGLRMLDLSADGFWNSFLSIVVAIPPLVLGWIAVANDSGIDPTVMSRGSVIAKLAVIDLASWIVPIVAFAVAAKPLGLADRFVHYVVATNWGSAVIVWLMVPITMLRLTAWVSLDVIISIWLIFWVASLVLAWRLTNQALERGPAVATGIFFAMLILGLIILFGLQSLLGLSP